MLLAMRDLFYVRFILTLFGVSAPCIVELLFPHLGACFIYHT